MPYLATLFKCPRSQSPIYILLCVVMTIVLLMATASCRLAAVSPFIHTAKKFLFTELLATYLNRQASILSFSQRTRLTVFCLRKVKMNVIITGATGLVGGELVRQAIASNKINHAFILTRRPIPEKLAGSDKVTVIQHDDFSTYPGETLEKLRDVDGCLW